MVLIGGISGQAELLSTLSHSFTLEIGSEPEIAIFDRVVPTDKICIVVSELEKPLLSDMSEHDFACKSILTVVLLSTMATCSIQSLTLPNGVTTEPAVQ